MIRRTMLALALLTVAPMAAHAAGDRDHARPHLNLMRLQLANCGNDVRALLVMVNDPRTLDPNAVAEVASDLRNQLDGLRDHVGRLAPLAGPDGTFADDLNAMRARLEMVDADLRTLTDAERSGAEGVRAATLRLDVSLRKATDTLARLNGDFGLGKLPF